MCLVAWGPLIVESVLWQPATSMCCDVCLVYCIFYVCVFDHPDYCLASMHICQHELQEGCVVAVVSDVPIIVVVIFIRVFGIQQFLPLISHSEVPMMSHAPLDRCMQKVKSMPLDSCFVFVVVVTDHGKV